MSEEVFIDGHIYQKSVAMDPMKFAAQLFARANSSDQAMFFSYLSEEVEKYPNQACFQWSYLAMDMEPKARAVFEAMADEILVKEQ